MAGLAAAAAFTAAGQSTASDLPSAVAAYGQAWASRDADRIVALHTEDTDFVLFVDGVEPAVGR